MIESYVSPEELRRLLSSLLVFVGVLLLFGLFAFIVVPGLRNANRPEAGSPVNPPQGESGWLDVTEYPPAKGYVIPPVDPKPLLVASPQNLERGKGLFAANCAPCHGNEGRGDGLAGKTLVPPPRNLTSPIGWMNGYQLAPIYRTLGEGIRDSSMAAFTVLSPQDRMALAHYVQSLGNFSHGDAPKELEALAKQLASQGQAVPDRIPVSWAMTYLEKERGQSSPVLLPAVRGTPEAELLGRVISDPARAARTLEEYPAWREDLAAFEAAVAAGAPANGFAVGAATLEPSEWRSLQVLIARLMPASDGQPPAVHWKGEGAQGR